MSGKNRHKIPALSSEGYYMSKHGVQKTRLKGRNKVSGFNGGNVMMKKQYGVITNRDGTEQVVKMSNNKEIHVHRNDVGFLSPELPGREETSYWGVIWNEFFGTLVYAFASRIFVAIFGGTTIASSIPTLYGTAFANAFAYFGAMATFGAISGGHFNPAITFAVLLIEFSARMEFFGKFHWKGGFGSKFFKKSPWQSWWGLIPYFFVQFAAFIIASLLIWGLLQGSPRSLPIALGMQLVTGNSTLGKTFGAELLASFLFIMGYMILLKMFGWNRTWLAHVVRCLGFGFWYFALIISFGYFAGAVWNPGLWIAFAIISGQYNNWWVLFFPPLISAIAVTVFCVFHWWIGQKGGFDKELKQQVPATKILQ